MAEQHNAEQTELAPTEVAGSRDSEAAPTAAPAQPEARRTGASFDVGDVIGNNRYRLDKLLGEGGMGKVFLATDLLFQDFKDRQAKVALKLLGERFGEHSVSTVQLQREASRSQKLAHPNVVRVLHFDMHEGVPFMVMEYLQGQPLDIFIEQARGKGRPLAEVLPVIEDIAAGLEYIHQEGLVHLDLKPGNVFITEGGSAKILDMGIAQLAVTPDVSGEMTAFDAKSLGALTPAYASCEMFEGLEPDPRDDIYALAVIAYELLAGEHPFQRLPAPQARAAKQTPQRPPTLDRQPWHAILHGLALTREDRIPSSVELAEALRGEKSRRKKITAGLAALSLIGLASAALLGVQAMQPEDPDAAWRVRMTAMSEGGAPLEPDELSRVEGWLDQGRAYLGIADEVFRAGDILAAHQILQVGADNASAAFQSVLALTPSPEAQQGMFDIVGLYGSWAAQALADDNATYGLWMACHGLTLHSESRELLSLAERARRGLSDAANTDCSYMRKQTP